MFIRGKGSICQIKIQRVAEIRNHHYLYEITYHIISRQQEKQTAKEAEICETLVTQQDVTPSL